MKIPAARPGPSMPRNVNALAALVDLYLDQNQTDKAIYRVNRAIEKDPKNHEFRLYLGSFYEQVAAYDKAETALKDGLGLDPTSTNVTVANPFPVKTSDQTVPLRVNT